LPLPEVAVPRREVTLMLKISLLSTLAFFFAGVFGKSEGQNWG
jgi:hypothetical protein